MIHNCVNVVTQGQPKYLNMNGLANCRQTTRKLPNYFLLVVIACFGQMLQAREYATLPPQNALYDCAVLGDTLINPVLQHSAVGQCLASQRDSTTSPRPDNSLLEAWQASTRDTRFSYSPFQETSEKVTPPPHKVLLTLPHSISGNDYVYLAMDTKHQLHFPEIRDNHARFLLDAGPYLIFAISTSDLTDQSTSTFRTHLAKLQSKEKLSEALGMFDRAGSYSQQFAVALSRDIHIDPFNMWHLGNTFTSDNDYFIQFSPDKKVDVVSAQHDFHRKIKYWVNGSPVYRPIPDYNLFLGFLDFLTIVEQNTKPYKTYASDDLSVFDIGDSVIGTCRSARGEEALVSVQPMSLGSGGSDSIRSTLHWNHHTQRHEIYESFIEDADLLSASEAEKPVCETNWPEAEEIYSVTSLAYQIYLATEQDKAADKMWHQLTSQNAANAVAHWAKTLTRSGEIYVLRKSRASDTYILVSYGWLTTLLRIGQDGVFTTGLLEHASLPPFYLTALQLNINEGEKSLSITYDNEVIWESPLP